MYILTISQLHPSDSELRNLLARSVSLFICIPEQGWLQLRDHWRPFISLAYLVAGTENSPLGLSARALDLQLIAETRTHILQRCSGEQMTASPQQL